MEKKTVVISIYDGGCLYSTAINNRVVKNDEKVYDGYTDIAYESIRKKRNYFRKQYPDADRIYICEDGSISIIEKK